MKVSPRRKTMKWKRRKKGKAKGFQRRQPLERFPNIKEKGLQRVLLIWYLCSPSPCPQACSSWCTKGSCSPRTAPCPHTLPASSSDSLTLALHTHHSSFAVVEARWDWAGSPQSQRAPAGLYPRAWLLLHPACRYRWAPLFCPSSWGTCLALSHSPTSAHSHFPSAGQHFCFPPSILFLFLFAPFSCPSLPCLCIFAEVQGRCLLYFPCLQSTLTPSCLELPRAGCREHTSQVRRGGLQLSVNWRLSVPFTFPSDRKKLLTANPFAPHQGLLLPARKFGFSSPWTLQAAPASAALQRVCVCCNFFYRVTPNTPC